jgi:hypothetical protein
MAKKISKWRMRCETENAYVYQWSEGVPDVLTVWNIPSTPTGPSACLKWKSRLSRSTTYCCPFRPDVDVGRDCAAD